MLASHLDQNCFKQGASNSKKRKYHVNLDSITFQRKSQKNFRFTLKLPKIIRTSIFIIEKLKTHI